MVVVCLLERRLEEWSAIDSASRPSRLPKKLENVSQKPMHLGML